MANAYVIDTSTIISNPDVVKKSRRHGVIIPGVVLRQLDGLKSSKDGNTAYWARKASQAIERQQRKGNLLIMSESVRVDTLPNKADNQIIGTALWVSRHNDSFKDKKVKNVILVSTDRNMRITAANCGLKAEGIKERNTKLKTLRTILVSSYIITGLSFVLAMSDSLKLSDDIYNWLAIISGVFFVITVAVGMVVLCSCGNASEHKDDDMLMYPAFDSLSCNIHHEW